MRLSREELEDENMKLHTYKEYYTLTFALAHGKEPIYNLEDTLNRDY